MKRLWKWQNPINLARAIVDIATGEINDEVPNERYKSGEAWAKASTPEERHALARKGAEAHWKQERVTRVLAMTRLTGVVMALVMSAVNVAAQPLDCLPRCVEADLRGADLQGVNLQGANLQGAYLQGANLEGANLSGADLRRADLQGANLRAASLSDANLRHAILHGADMFDADLRGADLVRAGLMGGHRAKRRRARCYLSKRENERHRAN